MGTERAQLVAIVDDDESVRDALCTLLKSYGLEPRPFASAEEFLLSADQSVVACLVTDVCMSGMSGLDLQLRLLQENRRLPTIFITAHADARARAQALDAGAIVFLEKPFDDDVLIESIRLNLGP
jgi:FixJ family two-component response regulator